MKNNRNETIDLFVPGRLCLFGEHSDWAGLHRVINSSIVPGQAIVSGIEQGIYATVSAADQFIIESDLTEERFVCDMDTALLKEKANEGGYFSYVAGVASYVNEYYSVGGVRIHITKQTLPIKSGLSSSAAICVLAARAFNQIYKLRISIMGEMQIAFYGEQRTPSRCGRLDQACAYGVKPVHMVFNGNEIETRPLKIAKPMYWVIADLKAGKDTVKILSDLNKCYPFAQNELEETVQQALGKDNERIVQEAAACIESGDIEALGALMTEAQENFDKKVAPACPEELTSPVLHSVLNDEHIRPWIYGCKGVGSQGDGTVQFLAKDEESRKKLIRYLEEERGMDAFTLTLKPKQKVRKAIIPVAGFGTRLYPATKAIKKDFLPVLDKDGMFKPVLMVLLEELVASGIEKICLVIGEDEQPVYDDFFARMSEENYEKLPEEKQKYEDFISGLRSKITYVYQRERKGFGHAVFQSREFAGDDPVLLLLGDTIYESSIGKTCSQQMIDAYEEYDMPVISMHDVPLEEVVHYGIMRGSWVDDKERYAVLEEIAEKPTAEYALENLKMPFKQTEENYYAVFGQYILTKEVYDVLEKNIREGNYSRGEIQLTDALEEVRRTSGMMGCRIRGESYDVGLPEMYIDTISRFGRK